MPKQLPGASRTSHVGASVMARPHSWACGLPAPNLATALCVPEWRNRCGTDVDAGRRRTAPPPKCRAPLNALARWPGLQGRRCQVTDNSMEREGVHRVFSLPISTLCGPALPPLAPRPAPAPPPPPLHHPTLPEAHVTHPRAPPASRRSHEPAAAAATAAAEGPQPSARQVALLPGSGALPAPQPRILPWLQPAQATTSTAGNSKAMS